MQRLKNIDLNRGLSTAQAEELTRQGMDNKPVENQSKTIKQIIAGNVFTYFNFIFIAFTVLLVLVGSYRDISFMPVILANMLIGIIQEIRSKKVLDKLTVLNAPKAVVIRDGVRTGVEAKTLVLNDVVVFAAGNQICADAVVGEGEVQVNEALITGEADEITKVKGDKLLSGSFVVSGECKAVLEKVGYESYISKLTIEAKKTKRGQQSEMMRSLDKLVKFIGILIIPLGIALFCVQHFVLEESIKASVVASIAALIGMIPEGLYLLASVALAVGVIRLARVKVLVHQMSCIETLARVNVLCVDKTGTITENKMQVSDIIPLDNYIKGYRENSLHEMIGEFVNNMTNDNITMSALIDYFNVPAKKKAICTTSFSSATKYSSVTFEDGTYVIGAPEFVLKEDYNKYKDIIEEYSLVGYRVLVYGLYEGEINGKTLEKPVMALALILISNPIRKEAKQTFEYFDAQGVTIKVISGDNPITVSNVAVKAGIKSADKYIDAAKLDTQEKIKAAINEYTVFGRVTPNQKRQFVKALQESGSTVAMTGDGVNDVLALKDADCSVAMASGSDAAANAAQLVLLDSNFACMPAVVAEGRRVVNNIQRSASLFLVKNIFSITMCIFSLIFTLKYPLVPSQLSLLGVFTIGAPAFLLALQPNKNIIKGHFMTNVLLKALPSGLTDFFMVAVLSLAGEYFDVPFNELSTVIIYVLLAVGIITLIRVCRPFDIIRIIICVMMIMGIFIVSITFSNLFALYVLDFEHWIMFLICISVAVPMLFGISYIIDVITEYIAKHNKHFRKRLGK